MAPRRSMTYGPGAGTCAEDAAGRRTAIAITIAAPVRDTPFPPALLAALRLPPFSPVLPHSYRHRSPPSGGHRATPAPPAPCRLANGGLGPTSATKELWKLATDRRFFLTELLEPRHRAQPCEPAQLFLLSLIHISEPTRLLSISYA